MSNVSKRIVLDIDDLANNEDMRIGLRIEQLDFIIKQSQKLREDLEHTQLRLLTTVARGGSL